MRYQKSWMFVLGVAAAACIFWFLEDGTKPVAPTQAGHEQSEVPSVAEGDAPTIAGQANTPPISTAPKPTTPQLPPNVVSLPDNRLPLSQQIDALKERVEHGDPVAACRLALDALRCRATARVQQVDGEIVAGIARRKATGRDDFMVGVLAHSAEQTDASARFCDGVDATAIPDIDQLPERAVNAMSTRQKVLMALSQPNGGIIRLPKEIAIPPGSGSSTTRIMPQFVADHAYEFLQQGIAAADPLALEGMLMVHVPSWIPGTESEPRIASPNPKRFAIYALTMRGVYGDEALGGVAGGVLQNIMQTMTPEQLASLQIAADREVTRWKSVSMARGKALTADVSMDDAQLCLE